MTVSVLTKNNARSTLLAGITDVATSLSVQSGHGTRFSAPTGVEIAKLTLYDNAGNIEICHGTTRSGDGWSVIVRGQEGTTARAWNAGDGISENATAGFLTGLSQLDRNETVTGTRKYNAAVVQQGSVNYASTSGTDTYTVTLGLTAFVAGAEFRIKFVNSNATSAPTINPDSLGAKNLKDSSGGALVPGQLLANSEHTVRYNGTDMIVLTAAGRVTTEPVRQTVLTGAVDSNGQANFLSAGTGLAVSRAATTTPVVVTVAAGEDEIGPINYRKRFAADQASYWASLAPNNLSYLFDDLNTGTGVWTAYSTIIPRQSGAFFDATKQALLPFSGSDASTTITDTYGNAWTASGNAQIDTAVTIDGQNTVLLDGTGDYVGNTTITTLGDGGCTLETKGRINTLPGVGTAMTLISFTNATGYGAILELMNTGGTYNLRLYLSSDGTTHNIANALLGSSSTYATGTDYHFAVVCDPVAGNYYTYRNGAVDETVASTAKICALTIARLGSTYAGGSYLNGALAGFRFSPCCRYPAGTTFTAPTLPFTADAEWFDRSTFTYKYGSPTSWATKQRVCVGQTTTNGTVPTETITYALKCEYEGVPAQLAAAGTVMVGNHNIGTDEIDGFFYLRCKTAEYGYLPGDVVRNFSGATYYGTEGGLFLGRKTISTGSLTNYFTTDKATVALVNLTVANWDYFFVAKRRW